MTEPGAAFLARMEALGPDPSTVAQDDLLRLLRLAGDTVSAVYQSVDKSPRNRLEVEAEGFRGLLEEARAMLPRIEHVVPGRVPLTLEVQWRGGGESLVDVSGLVGAYRAYAPLRDDPALFGRVQVGEHGTDVVWAEGIDMAADTLWRLAQEQGGTAGG